METTMKIVYTLIALALSVVPASAKGFYVTGHAGANWDDVISAKGVDSDAGFVIGGAVGTDVKAVPGLRVELEATFSNNEVNVFKFLNIDHDTTTLMGNLAYDLPVELAGLHPYVLVGAGYGHSEATLESIALARVESSGLAWQLGAGVQTELAEGVRAGVGYRYVQAPELEVFGLTLSDGTNHRVMASVTFDLN